MQIWFVGTKSWYFTWFKSHFVQNVRIMRIISKKCPSGVSIGCVHRVCPSGGTFILNISTILGSRPKKLFAYVEMVCKVYNNKAITLKKSLRLPPWGYFFATLYPNLPVLPSFSAQMSNYKCETGFIGSVIWYIIYLVGKVLFQVTLNGIRLGFLFWLTRGSH